MWEAEAAEASCSFSHGGAWEEQGKHTPLRVLQQLDSSGTRGNLKSMCMCVCNKSHLHSVRRSAVSGSFDSNICATNFQQNLKPKGISSVLCLPLAYVAVIRNSGVDLALRPVSQWEMMPRLKSLTGNVALRLFYCFLKKGRKNPRPDYKAMGEKVRTCVYLPFTPLLSYTGSQ